MDQKNSEKKTMEKENGPIHLLKEEHQATLSKLERIERSLHSLLRPAGDLLPERVEIEKVLLRDLAIALEREMGPHFRKEEEGLFPILAEYIGKEYGPIEVMEREHEKILLAFQRWKKILPPFCRSAEPIDEGIRKAVIDPGLRLVDLLRQHIGKENQILFRISESALTPDEKKEVLYRMEATSRQMKKKD